MEIENVKSCWQKIIASQGEAAFVEFFYNYLFTHYPETIALFSNDLKQQKTILAETLNNVLNGIEHVELLETDFFSLGQKHKSYGVTKEMFDVFIIAIVEVAKIATNNTLTEKELKAWEEAFKSISDSMLKAYN